jgi:hypothetical protein
MRLPGTFKQSDIERAVGVLAAGLLRVSQQPGPRRLEAAGSFATLFWSSLLHVGMVVHGVRIGCGSLCIETCKWTTLPRRQIAAVASFGGLEGLTIMRSLYCRQRESVYHRQKNDRANSNRGPPCADPSATSAHKISKQP